MWVIFVALVARSRALLRWVHIICLIWGILIEIRPWPRPLTLLENRLGEPGWRRTLPGGFLLRYLDALVYPNISSAVLTVAGVVVCTLNLVLYARTFWIGPKRSS